MAEASYTPRLKSEYEDSIRGIMTEQFNYQNRHQVPRLEKIVLNMGVGEATADSKKPTVAAEDLAPDHRPKAGRHPRPQLHRRLQGPRRNADRRQGHAAS